MDNTYIIIIISLLGFLQTIFMAILGYMFKIHGTIFAKIDKNKKSSDDKIEYEKKEFTKLLDTHYVTNGQLSTIEERLMGAINNLDTTISHLTDVIKGFENG